MAQKKNNPLKGKRHSNINGARKLKTTTSYQVGEIFFPTKEALSKEAKGESPNYTQQSQKTLQQRRKSNGQKTTKKEINK